MLEHLDAWLPVLKVDGHHVEATRTIRPAPSHQPVGRDPHDLLLLPGRDRRQTAAVLIAGPRLDLDEDHCVSNARDDVDFAVSGAIPALKNCVPTAHQLLTREVLARFSKELTTIRTHGQKRVQGLSLTPAQAS